MGCNAHYLEMLSELLALPAQLTDVLGQLSASADQLDVACIADVREVTVSLKPGMSAELEQMVRAAGGDAHMTKDGGGLAVRFSAAKAPDAGGWDALATLGNSPGA